MKIQPLTPSHTLSAWQEQLTEATQDPRLRVQLAQREQALFPRFAANYQHLTALPRRVRRSLQCQWKRSLAGVALLMALGQGPALAAAIAVDGSCTLVDAITAANTDTATGGCPTGSGVDIITLPADSTHTLTTVNNSTFGPTGLPVVSSEITIQGDGSTIARSTDTGTPEFRIFAINSNGNLTLEQTTITGGSTSQDDGYYNYNDGGGIANYDGTVTLIDSTVSGNYYGGGVANSGTIAMFNSAVSGNNGGYYGSRGGGGVANGGTMTLYHSAISDNVAYGYGSGVVNGGTMTLTDSTISGNIIYGFGTAGHGGSGGVANFGTLTLNNSTVSGNIALHRGGGISNYGTLILYHSTISGNTVNYQSVFGSDGGGIANYGTITLVSSIISGNVAGRDAEVNNRGTISANGYNFFGHSGLTNAQAFYDFTPRGTDITATSDGTHPTALGAILQVDNTGAPLLQNNGGLTKTIALAAGSPAIDASRLCRDRLITDQRGYPRPVDGDGDNAADCDIGAFEFGVDRLNDQLTFAPIPSTFRTTTGAGAKGCPITFEGGAFSFKARLKNKSGSPPFTHLGVQVITLTNGNALLLDAATGATGEAGAILPVPTIGNYADQMLNPNEQVKVPFTICLQNPNSFAFFVDVFGQENTP